MKKKLLFLCTGNYFRSKFAEIYFNHLVRKNNLNWEAFSRGFYLENPDNVGWISQFAMKKLNELRIPIIAREYPRLISLNDLENAQMMIILNEAEHRPFIRKLFPEWEDKFIYWNIFDKQDVSPALALSEVQKNIENLVSNLC